MNFEEYRKYPICDTDIWVYVCLGGIEDKLIRKYKKILMADVVVQEISAWNIDGYKYNYIYHNFKKYLDNNDIIEIKHTEINEEDKCVLEVSLYQYGFENGFENLPKEEHKGEIVSAIYADHFRIPILASNDGAFKEDGDAFEMFEDLEVYDWLKIAEILTNKAIEKVKLMTKVDTEQSNMNRNNKKFKEKQSV